VCVAQDRAGADGALIASVESVREPVGHGIRHGVAGRCNGEAVVVVSQYFRELGFRGGLRLTATAFDNPLSVWRVAEAGCCNPSLPGLVPVKSAVSSASSLSSRNEISYPLGDIVQLATCDDANFGGFVVPFRLLSHQAASASFSSNAMYSRMADAGMSRVRPCLTERSRPDRSNSNMTVRLMLSDCITSETL
jgi:hypothetical protein